MASYGVESKIYFILSANNVLVKAFPHVFIDSGDVIFYANFW